jgi:hypothetical protein
MELVDISWIETIKLFRTSWMTSEETVKPYSEIQEIMKISHNRARRLR